MTKLEQQSQPKPPANVNGRNDKLTSEAVLHAIESIDREGHALTLERVRNYLGGGSFTTINPVLKKWKSDREIHRTHPVEMPTELRMVMERMGAQMWAKANNEAAEKVRAAEARLHDKEADYISERDSYELENKRLEELTNKLQKELIDVRVDMKTIQGDCLTLTTQNARLEERLNFLTEARDTASDNLKKQLAINEDQQKDVETLEKQIARASGENTVLKESTMKAEAESRTLKRKTEKQADELATIREEKRAIEAARDQLSIEKKELAEELAKSIKAAEGLTKELSESNAEKEALSGQLAKSIKAVEAAEAFSRKLEQEITASKARAADLQGKLSECESKVKQHDLLSKK